MLGKAKLLKIYIGESQHCENKPLYQYLVHWFKKRGISGVTVSRGIEGYGADKVLHTARLLELSSDLPMVIEAVDAAEKIEQLIPEVCKLVPKGLVLAEDVHVYKHGEEM